MLIEQSQEELNAAQIIQSKCELKHVVLAACDVAAFGPEDLFKAPFKLNFTHECSAKLNDRNLAISAVFVFKSIDASESAAPVFNIRCVYELAYALQEGCNPNTTQIDAFKKGNAVYNCWPYVREFVQNISARMGFQPPPLPLLRVKAKQETKAAAPVVANT